MLGTVSYFLQAQFGGGMALPGITGYSPSHVNNLEDNVIEQTFKSQNSPKRIYIIISIN